MKLLYTRNNLLRKPKFQVGTFILEEYGNMFVRKYITSKEAATHLLSIVSKSKLLEKSTYKLHYPKLLKQTKSYIDYEFIDLPSLEKLIEESIINRNYKKSYYYINKIYTVLGKFKKVKANPYSNHEFEKLFDPKVKYNENKISNCIQPAFIDLNYDNILFDDNTKKFYLVDLEWVFNIPIPEKYILFRSLYYLSLKLQPIISVHCSKTFPCLELSEGLLIPKIWFEQGNNYRYKEIIKFLEWETNFNNYLMATHNGLIINIDKHGYKKIITTRQSPNLDLLIKSHNNWQGSIEKEAEIKKLNSELSQLKNILGEIKGSKFFKLWQMYCNIRDNYLINKSDKKN